MIMWRGDDRMIEETILLKDKNVRYTKYSIFITVN